MGVRNFVLEASIGIVVILGVEARTDASSISVSYRQLLSDGIWGVAVSPSFAIDQTIYAGSFSGFNFYKSTDGGVHWQSSQPFGGTFDYNVAQIALSPNYQTGGADQNVFVSGSGRLLRGSNNGGTTFYTPGSPNLNGSVLGLAVSPNFAVDHTVIAASDAGILKSTDSGHTYVSSNTGQAWTNTQTLSFSPNYRNDRTIFSGNNGSGSGVYKSTDGGASWVASGSGLPITPGYTGPEIQKIEVSPTFAVDRMVFAFVGGYGLYRSSDAGATWTKVLAINTLLGEFELSSDFFNDHLLVAQSATANTWISYDSGSNWASITNWPGYTNEIVSSPNFAVDHTFYAGSYYGPTGLFSITVPVPEPSMGPVLLLGGAVLLVRRRSRNPLTPDAVRITAP